MSGMILLIGSLAVATKELNFGIDFESGTRVTASLERDATRRGACATRSARSGWTTPRSRRSRTRSSAITSSRSRRPSSAPAGCSGCERLLDHEFGVTTRGLLERVASGPTFGETVARSAVFAIIASLLLIMAYVAFRFEPKFAIPVMIALFHDLLITAGVYSLTGREVTTSTVAALLTILGFSLYDT